MAWRRPVESPDVQVLLHPSVQVTRDDTNLFFKLGYRLILYNPQRLKAAFKSYNWLVHPFFSSLRSQFPLYFFPLLSPFTGLDYCGISPHPPLFYFLILNFQACFILPDLLSSFLTGPYPVPLWMILRTLTPGVAQLIRVRAYSYTHTSLMLNQPCALWAFSCALNIKRHNTYEAAFMVMVHTAFVTCSCVPLKWPHCSQHGAPPYSMRNSVESALRL